MLWSAAELVADARPLDVAFETENEGTPLIVVAGLDATEDAAVLERRDTWDRRSRSCYGFSTLSSPLKP